MTVLGALLLVGCGDGRDPAALTSATGPTEPAAVVSTADAADAVVPQRAAVPNLASCKPYGPAEYRDRQASGPLKFPARFKGVAAARPDQLAVLTLSGGTLCVDARWQDEASQPELSADARFFGFAWNGYEEFGYTLIDRAGGGIAMETGARPVPSPSGRRLASVQYTESGFEAFTGVMILQVAPGAMRQIGKIESLPEGLTEWTFDAWKTDSCFEIHAFRFDDIPNGKVTAATPRQRFVVREVNRQWAIEAFDSCVPA